MLEAFVALMTIAGLLLKHWLAARAEERNPTYEKDAAQFDLALVGRDTDALSTAFEQLRDPAAIGGGDPGGPDDPGAAERQL